MKKDVFTGSAVALITPFNDDLSVNYEALGEIIDFQIENKTDAILVCGTTGESAALSDEEHKKVIEYAVKKVGGRVPVIAGAGSNDTSYSVQLSQHAQSAGVDTLLLVTPYYNKTTQPGLVNHYAYIANSVSLPIILYSVPSRTGLNITPWACKELSKIENIVAIKEASSNIEQIAEIAASCPDFTIYSGNDDQVIPIMSLGGKGVISVLSNICPKETHDMCQKFLEGDLEGARALQFKYFGLVKALFSEVNPIPVKAAMNLMGLNAGPLRMPLCEISEAAKSKLKDEMKKVGLI